MKEQKLTWRARGRLWFRIGIRLVLLLAGLWLLWKVGLPLLSLLAPFVAALITAAILHPVVRWLRSTLGGSCSATSFLRNWDSILEKKRANLRSISEPARLRQPPPQKHGSGTRKRAGSKHTGGATNSRPSRAFCPLVG